MAQTNVSEAAMIARLSRVTDAIARRLGGGSRSGSWSVNQEDLRSEGLFIIAKVLSSPLWTDFLMEEVTEKDLRNVVVRAMHNRVVDLLRRRSAGNRAPEVPFSALPASSVLEEPLFAQAPPSPERALALKEHHARACRRAWALSEEHYEVLDTLIQTAATRGDVSLASVARATCMSKKRIRHIVADLETIVF